MFRRPLNDVEPLREPLRTNKASSHQQFTADSPAGAMLVVRRARGREMNDSIAVVQAATPQMTPWIVVAIVGASTLFVIGLLVLIGYFAHRAEKPLDHGNFFVVALGIMTALIGFLVAFPLLISRVFTDPTQVLALLSALFGTIVGLVGTYFGVKASSDASEGAQRLASETIANDSTPPQVASITPPHKAQGIIPKTTVTATFSKDMNPATVDRNTFKLIEQVTFTPVAGDVTYDTATKRACFQPAADLTNGTTYQATVTAAVKDKAGNAMAQGHTWEFTVA